MPPHRLPFEQEIAESEERLALMANSVPAMIAYLDRGQRFRFANRTYGAWFGIPHETIEGRTLREVIGERLHGQVAKHVERVLAGHPVEFDYSLGEGDAERFLQVAYAPHLDAGGEVVGFYELASDVTALKRAQQHQRRASRELATIAARLEYLAHHDPLTELPNRVMLQERLRQAVSLARRHHKQLALLFVDLDHFKNVNDSLGHDAGDRLLQAAAQRLVKSTRPSDTVARLGGDEFAILLADAGTPQKVGTLAPSTPSAVTTRSTQCPIRNGRPPAASPTRNSITPEGSRTLLTRHSRSSWAG